MSYRIRYEVRRGKGWQWGILVGSLLWGAAGLEPVWRQVAAGEGLYVALARFVGGKILGSC